MDQYVVPEMVVNKENLTNPVSVEPRASAALTTTSAPAVLTMSSGGVCVRLNHVSCTCQCNHSLQIFPHELRK